MLRDQIENKNGRENMRMVKRDIGKKWINGLDMTAKLEEERERVEY